MKRSDMDHLKGKSALLEFDYYGKRLYFKAIVIKQISKTHISFTDKFGKDYAFRLTDLVEVSEVG